MVGRKKKLICGAKLLLVIPLVLAMSPSVLFVSERLEEPLRGRLWGSVFGSISAGEIQSIVMSTENIGVLFLFTLLFASNISGFFEKNSHMIFSRIQNRGSWSLKRILEIWGLAAGYTVIFLAFKFFLESRKVMSWQWDGELTGILLVIFGIFCPVLAVICLTANWIAIRQGVPVGVLLAFVVVLVLEVAAILWYDSTAMKVFNPLCSNRQILDTPPAAAFKVGMNTGYLLLLSAGMLWDMRRKDIF